MRPLSRRTVLRSGMLGLAAAAAPRLAGAAGPHVLTAAPATAQIAPEGYPRTEVWAYDGQIPGPELRVTQGGRIARRLVNELPQPTSVHWHGIRIANAMDGVPDLTQDAVPPGGSFDYEFTVPDAGTFWYHTHNRSWEQMARGLAGPLIVEEARPPDVDADITLAIEDWRLTDTAQHVEDFGNMRDFSHAGRIGNLLTVNGAFELSSAVARHQRLRLRLINMSTARVLALGLSGVEGWVVALDGMPLAAPVPAGDQTLAPAQRADLIVDVTAEAGDEAALVHLTREGGFVLAAFPVLDGGAARRPAPDPLPPNDLAEPRLRDARPLTLTMQGGAMGGMMSGAMFGGRRMEMRELVEAGQVWSFNGVAGMPDMPLFAADRGETLRLTLVNETAWPHGIHVHGHHFRELDGGLPGPWRDTTLLGPRESREIALVADNPGRWLLHCHMLGHQASGMKTWFEVA